MSSSSVSLMQSSLPFMIEDQRQSLYSPTLYSLLPSDSRLDLPNSQENRDMDLAPPPIYSDALDFANIISLIQQVNQLWFSGSIELRGRSPIVSRLEGAIRFLFILLFLLLGDFCSLSIFLTIDCSYTVVLFDSEGAATDGIDCLLQKRARLARMLLFLTMDYSNFLIALSTLVIWLTLSDQGAISENISVKATGLCLSLFLEESLAFAQF